MKYTTTLSDYATVNLSGPGKAQSIHNGKITMISLRGITVKLKYASYFIKWTNVKEIITPEDIHETNPPNVQRIA